MMTLICVLLKFECVGVRVLNYLFIDYISSFQHCALSVVVFENSLFYIFRKLFHLNSFKFYLIKIMASQSQGIQQLLTAEKRAAEKVADAKNS